MSHRPTNFFALMVSLLVVAPAVAEEVLTAPDDPGGFGTCVAMSGDYAIVGAPTESVDGFATEGAAHIFERISDTWTWRARLTGDSPTLYRYLGAAVAISGTTALVGATGPGEVYVYVESGGSWVQQAVLTATGTSSFGAAVALSGNRAVVGDPDYWNAGTEQGAVFFFSRSGTVWGLDGMALANDGQLYDDFGASVALFALGYNAAVGAPGNDPTGAVYIFDRNSGTWQQQDKIVTTDAAGGAKFGAAVAGMGFDHVAVGAPSDAAPGVQSGSAFVFRFDGSDWVQDAKLVAHNGTEYDRFGKAVSLYSHRLLVGAPSHGSTALSYGAVYAYSNPGGSWQEIGWRKAGDRCGSLAFGNAVVVGPDEALVAAKNYKLVYALDWEEVPQVFMDRFECGNAAAWSAVVP